MQDKQPWFPALRVWPNACWFQWKSFHRLCWALDQALKAYSEISGQLYIFLLHPSHLKWTSYIHCQWILLKQYEKLSHSWEQMVICYLLKCISFDHLVPRICLHLLVSLRVFMIFQLGQNIISFSVLWVHCSHVKYFFFAYLVITSWTQ